MVFGEKMALLPKCISYKKKKKGKKKERKKEGSRVQEEEERQSAGTGGLRVCVCVRARGAEFNVTAGRFFQVSRLAKRFFWPLRGGAHRRL